MKILHINNEKTWRGGERQTLLLAAELQRRGIQNVVACRKDAPLAEQAARAGVPTVFVGANNATFLCDIAAIARKFSLLHCHTGRGHSIAAIQNVFTRTPMIITRRVDFLPRRTFFNRFKFSRARKVVCISGHICVQMREWGVPARKLAIIPSAVPAPSGSPTREAIAAELRKRLGIAETRKLVGNIAAFVPHKDQATLLRAARRLAELRPDVAVVIIGEGELRPQLEQLRNELGLEKTVFFAGFIPDAERFLPAFDVFVMSSAMEGLGSIVLDAFAAGVPVASTAGGGLPELVRHGETGLLVPVGNDQQLAHAVLNLLNAPRLAMDFAAKARKLVVANYSVAGMADRYIELYKQVAVV